MKLIVLIGATGSGKDSTANFLVKHYNFIKISFAETLKDVVASLFGWDRYLLEGDTIESRKWREQIDPYWNKTPRKALHEIGTDLFRKHYDDTIWIKSLEYKIHKIINENKYAGIVITDCRFENELESVLNFKNKYNLNLTIHSIYIQRDNDPFWVDKVFTDQDWLSKHNIHITDWLHFKLRKSCDNIIYNNSSIEDLETKLSSFFSNLLN